MQRDQVEGNPNKQRKKRWGPYEPRCQKERKDQKRGETFKEADPKGLPSDWVEEEHCISQGSTTEADSEDTYIPFIYILHIIYI